MTAPSRGRRLAMLLAQAVVFLFVAQAMVTFVALYHQSRDTLTGKVRWYGSETSLPGVPTQQQVIVVDRDTGRARADAHVRVSTGSAGAEMEAEWTGVGFELLRPSDANVMEVSVTAAGMLPRTLRHTQRAGEGGWLDDASRLTAGSTPRRPELGGPSDGPRVWIRTPDDGCSHVVTISANGGVVARGLDNRVWIRVTDEAGRPVVGQRYRLTPRDAEEVRVPLDLTTDLLGVAEFRWRPMTGESWTMTGACGDRGLERRISGTPSWDGVLVRVTPPFLRPSATVRVGVTHQREWGSWYLDAWCDGVWLRGVAVDVRGGEGVVDLPVALPADRSRWCTLQGSTIRYANDPPRSLQNVLLLGPGQDERSALLDAAQSVARTGDALALQLAPLSLAPLARADDDTVARFAQWFVNRLPHVYQQPPLLLDDETDAVAEWSLARSSLRRWLLVALGVDGMLVLLAVLGILIPAARRQRLEMNLAMSGAFDELPAPVDRPYVVIGLGMSVLLAVGLGFVQLILYLR
ncbi:MAG: hypothetical protein ACI81R_001981 [Bradymonadia bacterium]|jgi:hypothetical protein